MSGKPNIYYLQAIKQNTAKKKSVVFFFLILASTVDTVKTHKTSMAGSLSLYLRNLIQLVPKERNLTFMSKENCKSKM